MQQGGCGLSALQATLVTIVLGAHDGLHVHSQMHSGRIGHLAVLPLVLPVRGIPMLPPLQLKLDKQQLQQQ